MINEFFTFKFEQETEEPNDSEVEASEDYQNQTMKVVKDVEITSETNIISSSADEEAVNKVAEKIDTLRMGPRQVRKEKIYNYIEITLKLCKGTRNRRVSEFKIDCNPRQRSS